MKKNIIIIGARGYEYNYGGWETFVTNLVNNYHDKNTRFYITHLTHKKEEDQTIIEKNNVTIPKIYVKEQGYKTMFTFTIKSVKYIIKYLQENQLENPILYILGCKVGPLFLFWKKTFHHLKVPIIINPDGLEWTRDKWPWWIKQCFKISERTMIKSSDYCICDSKAIQEYIDEKYQKYHPKTSFIAYGAYLDNNPKLTKTAEELMQKYHFKEGKYYLIVGRFIPENNYETMLKEYMKTNINKDLVIICNLEENDFYKKLKETTNFEKDKRIKFIGSVYDKETLSYFRAHAYAYIHGHSAGGTNPSLLEALSQTGLNILYDVAYNKEVGQESCFYFSKKNNSLKKVLNTVDSFTTKEQKKYSNLAKKRIKENYTWDIIVNKYQTLFTEIIENNQE